MATYQPSSGSSWTTKLFHGISKLVRRLTGRASGNSPDLVEQVLAENENGAVPGTCGHPDRMDEDARAPLCSQENRGNNDAGHSVAGPSLANLAASLEFIKRETHDEEFPSENELLDLDNHGNPIEMIRIPINEYNNLLQARDELPGLRHELEVVERQRVQPVETAVANGRTGGRPKRQSLAVHGTERLPKRRRQNVIHTCRTCQKVCATKGGLKRHQRSHVHPTGEYQCRECGRSNFKAPHSLRQHMVCHNATIACETCGKLFGSERLKKLHQRCSAHCKNLGKRMIQDH